MDNQKYQISEGLLTNIVDSFFKALQKGVSDRFIDQAKKTKLDPEVIKSMEAMQDSRDNLIKVLNKGIYDLENNYDCLLSCGVADDSSFELEFFNKYGTKPGFLFDGTIKNIPNNFPSEYYFIYKNISGHNDIHNTDLKDLIKSHKNIFLKKK